MRFAARVSLIEPHPDASRRSCQERLTWAASWAFPWPAENLHRWYAKFLGPLAVATAGSKRAIDLAWTGLAGLGVYLITGAAGGPVAMPQLAGLVLAAASAACWAGYILANAALGGRTHGGGAFALAIAWAAILTLPAGLARAGAALGQPHVLLGGLAVAPLSTVAANSLELEALRRILPWVFGVPLSLEPSVAALAGLAVLGQLLTLPQWLAVGCIITASIGATSRHHRHRDESPYLLSANGYTYLPRPQSSPAATRTSPSRGRFTALKSVRRWAAACRRCDAFAGAETVDIAWPVGVHL